MDSQNEPRDGRSPGAEGSMALPDSAEIEKSPEPGLEFRNLDSDQYCNNRKEPRIKKSTHPKRIFF